MGVRAAGLGWPLLLLLGGRAEPGAAQVVPMEGACETFAGCHVIMSEAVPDVGTVEGYPVFEADIQSVPEASSPEACLEECRWGMFSYALFQSGPVPDQGGRTGQSYFAGLCACADYGLNTVEVACALGSDGQIAPIQPGDEGKAQDWPGGVYYAYATLIGDADCDPRYAHSASEGGASAVEGGASTDEVDAVLDGGEPVNAAATMYNSSRSSTLATTSTSVSANRTQIYILMASGAGAMLVCVCLLWAMKQTLTSGRRAQRSSSSASGDSSGSQRPGLADNPIFEAAVFLPSETGNSALISTGGRGDGSAENAPLPVAEAPPSFFCPITQDLMRDPVLIGDGHTYERDAIKQWLAGHSTSPMTNAPLSESQRNMVPNHTLRSMIVDFVEKFVAENHLSSESAAVENEPDIADDGFVNPLSDSAPPMEDERTAPAGATFDVENGSSGEHTGSGGTFDVEEAGQRRRGRTGIFAARGRNTGSTPSSSGAAEAPSSEPEPDPQPDPAPAPLAPARLTGPYSIEEFDPELYSREEMQTVQVLLSQLASSGGLTFRVLAQYNVTCPRRMAEDRRRRAAFREQMQAQQRAAAAAAAAAEEERTASTEVG